MKNLNTIAPISNTKKLEFKHIITEDEIRAFLNEDLKYKNLNGIVYYIYVDLNNNEGVKICSNVLDFFINWNGFVNGFGFNVFNSNCKNSWHIDGFRSENKEQYEYFHPEAVEELFEGYLNLEVGRIASEIMEKIIEIYGRSAVKFRENAT